MNEFMVVSIGRMFVHRSDCRWAIDINDVSPDFCSCESKFVEEGMFFFVVERHKYHDIVIMEDGSCGLISSFNRMYFDLMNR